jgi:hypothetical protein
MKRIALVLALLAVGTLVFAQVNLPEHRFVSGRWNISGSRLYQNDASAGLAKVNIRAPQTGAMVYEFDARYEGGAEDGHGGFGLHIFVDNAYNEVSWGAGSSYLLWLNYDEKPSNRSIPAGLSAQIYRSRTNSQMDLVESFDLNGYAGLLTYESLSAPVPFKIIADGNTGEVQVYDPTVTDGTYYVFYLDRRYLPLRGNWVVLRTNGMKLSFSN